MTDPAFEPKLHESPLIAEFESLIQSAIMCLPAKLPDVREFLSQRRLTPDASQILELLRKETELLIRSDLLSRDPGQHAVARDVIARFPELSEDSRLELACLEWQLSRTLKRRLDLNQFLEQLADVIPDVDALRSRLIALESHLISQRSVPGPVLKPGQRLGSCSIVRMIGVGGMGEVYEADEGSELHRRVAIKVVRAENSSPEILRRFEAERRILAFMEHPNIAKVFSAGSTEGGLPYFVMELVKGISLSDYVARYRLALTDRLQLMIQICRAIHHVHQRGILHRDIKPSNILVTTEGLSSQIKIIDFGVAKAISPTVRLLDDPTHTVYGTVIGSFQYMSPEQAGTDILEMDVRSDVYSLGIVLYELLTGTTPVSRDDIEKSSRAALIERIRTTEAAAPGVVVARSDRPLMHLPEGQSVRQISRLLKGDLDLITLKAIEKERTRRYDSAAHLAEDLERYLRNEVVLATPPSAIYRFRKLWNRHRLAIQTACAAVVAAVFAMIFMVRMWIVARESQEAVQSALTEGLATSRAEAVPVVLESLASSSGQSVESLTNIRRSSSPGIQFRARCGLALIPEAGSEPVSALIRDWIEQPALADELYALMTACRRHPEAAVHSLRESLRRTSSIQVQARIAVLLLLLEDATTFRAVVQPGADTSLQTEIVQQIAELRGYTQDLCRFLAEEQDAFAVATVIQGLAESRVRSRSPGSFDVDSATLRSVLQDQVRKSDSALVVATADLALRRMGERTDELLRMRTPIHEFFVNSAGMMMIRLPAGSFEMGMRPDAPIVATTGCVRGLVQTRIAKDIYVADREVSIQAFRTFVESRRISGQPFPSVAADWTWTGAVKREAPAEDYPAIFIMWDDAIEYCNWLSLREGRQVCYEKDDTPVGSGVSESGPLNWLLNPAANGYRLPTHAEWEYACRGHSRTDQFFGTDRRQTAVYAVFGTSHLESGRSRLPNLFGLFDLYGSVYEWCWDCPCQYLLDYTARHLKLAANESGDRAPLPRESLLGLPENLLDPVGETHTLQKGLRGGTFWLDEGSCMSGYIHMTSRMHGRDRGFGFRVVCNAGEN